MAKIIVVDDDINDQEKVKKIIDPFLFKYSEVIKPLYFNKYNEKLKTEIEDKSERKIYIIDINLHTKITGINIAMYIREKDWDSEIIILTNHDNYYHKVYQNIFKVFAFIEKFDNMDERLSKTLKKILNKNCDNSMYKFSNNQIDLRIYLKDILYIHRDTEERKLVIKTTNSSFMVSKTFDEMLAELDSRFKKVHRACIVNTNRVCKYNWNKGEFILDTNEEVHLLSKKYKEEVV